MKITRNVPKPQPITVTLEITLDELIALKTFADYYAATPPPAARARAAEVAARRFVDSIPEDIYSWNCRTSDLFK